MIQYYFISLVIIILDQLTKYLTASNLDLGQTINLIPNVLSLTHVQNTGAAWSIFEGQMVFFYLVTILVVAFLIYLLHKEGKKSALLATAIAFMIGGALGNFIDRLFHQYVIDMIQVDFMSFPIFNIADIALTTGVILMLVAVLYDEYMMKGGEEGWLKEEKSG